MKNLKQEPIIRPGQRKPYRKGTRLQILERISYIACLIRGRNSKTTIHRAMKAKYNVEWRQCDRYMARAPGHARACGLRKPRVSNGSKRVSDRTT